MKYPNFLEEKKLWKKGIDLVVGLDEAGRGPLAGPVLAAAVIIDKNGFGKLKKLGLDDSKKISERKREEIFEIITRHPDIKWGIGEVSEKVIDKINILGATKLAMLKAVKDVEAKIKRSLGEGVGFLLIDGNFSIASPIAQASIIKGDQKVVSIATASIIAKVRRDRIMLKYDKKYPGYGFEKHKGYPTLTHRKVLAKIGPCAIHRKSFSLV